MFGVKNARTCPPKTGSGVTFVKFRDPRSIYKWTAHEKPPREGQFDPYRTGIGLTRVPLALQIFHHLLGGWTVNIPRLSRLLLVAEKNGKSIWKLVKNDYETISAKFLLRSKLWTSGAKNSQNFEFCFASVEQHFGKPPLSRERYYSYSKTENGIRKRIEFSIVIVRFDLRSTV